MSVEYVPYVLIVLVSVVACGFAIRAARPLPERQRSAAKSGRPATESPEASPVPGEQATHVVRMAATPVPWGWPSASGNPRSAAARRKHAAGGSSALQRWTDQLVAEKRTLDDQGYQARREESIRALLEDRFCSPKKGAVTGRTGDLNGHAHGPLKPASGDRASRESPADSHPGPLPLGDVRKPWGW